MAYMTCAVELFGTKDVVFFQGLLDHVTVAVFPADPSGEHVGDELLNCELFEFDPLQYHKQPEGNPDQALSNDLAIAPFEPRLPVQAIADSVPIAPVAKPIKKPRRSSHPPAREGSRSLGMDYELKNWDILCGRGRGEFIQSIASHSLVLSFFFCLQVPFSLSQETLSTLETSDFAYWLAATSSATSRPRPDTKSL